MHLGHLALPLTWSWLPNLIPICMPRRHDPIAMQAMHTFLSQKVPWVILSACFLSFFFFVQFPSVAEGLAMSLSFQGTYCLTPGKYDSVSLMQKKFFWDLRFGAEKGCATWRLVRTVRMRGPAVALFQARPPGRRLRVTALPSCMELSETQNRQNLAIHGIWMYGMLCMYGWWCWCCGSKPTIEGIFTLMESHGKLAEHEEMSKSCKP
jgi:hypothetical protein